MQIVIDISSDDFRKVQDGRASVSMMRKAIRNGTPLSVAEKVGEWKRISLDLYTQHATAYYKCSECGGDNIGKSKYCPNCGARMREVEE